MAQRKGRSPQPLPAEEGRGPSASLLTEDDLYLFNEGSHFRLYQHLGAHLRSWEGRPGAQFAVWAPDAAAVSVVGDFNGWNRAANPLSPRGKSGIWESFIPGAAKGQNYKYRVRSRHRGHEADKADPFAFRAEIPPKTGSVLWDLDYAWGDQTWMKARGGRNALASPQSVYEVHLPSWRRVPSEGDRPLTYRELAQQLPAYLVEMGFTHVEFMPVMEHPFGGSWGYQVTGFFAPSARQGSPQDFMALVDALHQAGLGVYLDWVPSHFPADEHGLALFDGTHLFEHADPRQGRHPDWDSLIFNYGRHEIRAFLISSALFWMDKYHADGLRVDAVASMLYLDYSRKSGEWLPNEYGGKENLEAIRFLRQLNTEVYKNFPESQTVAEESTAWGMVSRPVPAGGLGFGLKWDMGWMHDTLSFFSKDPVHRKFHQNQLTFRQLYAHTENFVLPLSHDEVVHGKGSLYGRMAGDPWQKRANLRLLLAEMWAQNGKKLLFMGGEFGQEGEWNHDRSLDWHLLEGEGSRGLQRWVKDLNSFYQAEPALFERDFDPGGFEWLDCSDAEQGVLAFLRWGKKATSVVLCVFNLTPVPRRDYRLGVPFGGHWKELLNSDASVYGGSGWGNFGGLQAEAIPSHGRPFSLSLALPPLGALFLRT